MKQLTYIASKPLSIQCESGEVNFKKGDVINICHDKKDNVWISYHEQSKGKVHAFEIDITDKEVFQSLLENVYLVQEELDSKISYEVIGLDEILVEGHLKMNELLQIMVESSFVKPQHEGSTIKVPVRRIKKELSARQKATQMKMSESFTRIAGAKKTQAKSIKLQTTKENKGYVIDTSILLNKSIKPVVKRVHESLVSYFGNKAKVHLMQENKLKVNLFNSDASQLKEVLESLKVNYVLEGTEDYKVVTLVKPQPKTVVRSYYSMKEMDDEIPSDEEEMDPKDQAMKMKEEMEVKCNSIDEEDIDQDKAKELMGNFDKKMEEMDGCDDQEGKEKILSEMDDIFGNYMGVMNGDAPEVKEPDEDSKDCEDCVDGLDPEGNECDCQKMDVDSEEDMVPMESKKKR